MLFQEYYEEMQQTKRNLRSGVTGGLNNVNPTVVFEDQETEETPLNDTKESKV